MNHSARATGAMSAEDQAPPAADHSFDAWISYVLRAGVLISAGIIAVGLTIFLIRGPQGDQPGSLHALLANGGHVDVVRPSIIPQRALTGHAFSLIRLGILVLILTPLARVLMTAVLFVLRQDWTFVFITTVVLAILVGGLLGIWS